MKPRLITAALLVIVVIGGVYYLPPVATALLLSVFLILAAWEWSALLGWDEPAVRIGYAMAAAVLAVAVWKWNAAPGLITTAYLLAVVWWIVACGLIVFAQFGKLGGYIRLASNGAVGLMILLSAWSAIVWLLVNDRAMLLSVFVLVWVADGAAFFVGKRWGQRRLASNVSPGKSWEGAIGGLVFGTLCAVVISYGINLSDEARLAFIVVAIFTIVASVVGDLFESMLKRNVRIKDSGQLLPGHGGVLDRIDGLIAAAPVFVAGLHHWVGKI